MKAEDVVSLELPRDLLLEALPRISQLPAEILILLRLLPRSSLDELVLMAQLLEHRRLTSLEIDNIRVGRERTENHCRYLLGNARVASDAHVREGTREPVVRRVSLKECILRIELDSVVNVRSTKDASDHWLRGWHGRSIMLGDTVGVACDGSTGHGVGGQSGITGRWVLRGTGHRIVGCMVLSGILSAR